MILTRNQLIDMTIEALQSEPATYHQEEPGEATINDVIRPTCDSPACLLGWMEFFYYNAMNEGEREALSKEAQGYGRGDWRFYHCRMLDATEDDARVVFSASTGYWPAQFRFDTSNAPKEEQVAKAIAYLEYIRDTGRFE
jgi:hypothetical protein